MISGFNPFTLAPFGDDADGEEDEEEGVETQRLGSDEKPKWVKYWKE